MVNQPTTDFSRTSTVRVSPRWKQFGWRDGTPGIRPWDRPGRAYHGFSAVWAWALEGSALGRSLPRRNRPGRKPERKGERVRAGEISRSRLADVPGP